MVGEMKRLNLKKGPDFICIGPHKTGTDWMYIALTWHPQVWMPPQKEVGYFWERAYLGKSSFYKRLASSHGHYAHMRQWFKRRMQARAQDLFKPRIDKKSLLWDLRHIALPRSDGWYLSLFDGDKVSGDVSPNYYELPEEEVEKISKLLPHVKIIISLRNPVERLWSLAKMTLCKNQNKNLTEISERQFLDFFVENTRLSTTHYVRLIERWKKYFPTDNVLVIFTDELAESPMLLFEKICRFLEIISPDDRLQQKINFCANKGLEGPLPYTLGQHLYRHFQQPILELAEYLPQVEYPRKWLAELHEKYDGELAETAQ